MLELAQLLLNADLILLPQLHNMSVSILPLQMETQQAVRYVHPDPESHPANKTYTTRSLTPARSHNNEEKLKLPVDVIGVTLISDDETSQYTMEALLGKVSYCVY